MNGEAKDKKSVLNVDADMPWTCHGPAGMLSCLILNGPAGESPVAARDDDPWNADKERRSASEDRSEMED